MPEFDNNVPHIARVYDYWLGGKDNFEVDRELGEKTIEAYPNIVFTVRTNRAFLARSVTYLARDAGVRQFLDIGTGIPTANNTHEVAQRLAPESRIVYADNDPVVLTHAQALLRSTPEGACAYLDADLREPGQILAAAAETLDFSKPVGVMLIAVMQFIADDDDARAITGQLLAGCAPGSFLTMTHPARDVDAGQVSEMVRRLNESVAEKVTTRDHDGVVRLFDGLELVPPGVVRAPQWRPESELAEASPAALWAGVGRKP